MNISSICNLFYASHYIPIALYDSNGFVCSCGFPFDDDPYPFVFSKLCKLKSPAVYVSSDTGYYGLVRTKDDSCYIIIGPIYSTNVTDNTTRAFISKNAIPTNKENEIAQFLNGIPKYSYNRFLNLLLFLHYLITGEELDITEAFSITNTEYQDGIGKNQSERAYEAREEQQQHGTYLFERQMLEYVKEGDVNGLKHFLMSAFKSREFKEGQLADTPLRQAKNLLIGLVAMIGKEAAIPGGLDIEQTYQLIDEYTQECELLQSVEDVKNLQYNALIDFTKRVSQQNIPEGVSKEVYSCMQYIASHINEPISTTDIVAISNRSRAYLFKRFGEELGMTIGEYIIYCKIREAKSLLRYTDKPLAEISNYLCFSSQSYFQNVFKKKVGVTPTQYRKRKFLE